MRIGWAVGVVIGWIALAGCEREAVTFREGEPPVTCAGPEDASCPNGQMCIDMPDDGCDPEEDMGCDGICVASQCAGILALPCADGLQCVDDPDDDCDPEGDGSDCPGICVEPEEPENVSEDPRAPGSPCAIEGRVYVGTDPGYCARVAFLCDAGMQQFHDACGCGCEPG